MSRTSHLSPELGMSKLSDYRLLSFDVYGTLIDWENGILAALQPICEKNERNFSRKDLLEIFHKLEREQQAKTPGMPYSQVLSTIYPKFAAALELDEPTAEQSREFGDSVGKWPAFPDTVDALKRLSKHYKLLVLSNVDRDSFEATNVGPLQGLHFDAIITAQDVGAYKPSLRNFEYMLQHIESEFGIGKDEVLQTAQSQIHDHHPASEMGIKSVWIVRPGATMGNTAEQIYDWKFDTMGDMADALEQEIA